MFELHNLSQQSITFQLISLISKITLIRCHCSTDGHMLHSTDSCGISNDYPGSKFYCSEIIQSQVDFRKIF